MKSAGLSVSFLVVCLGTSAWADSGTSKLPPKTHAPAIQPTAGASTLVGGSNGCSTPDVITGNGPHAFDLTTATTGTEGQNNTLCLFFGTKAIQSDVWFVWTATGSGTATLDVCGGSTVDTKVAVYDGSGCPVVEAIACNDDGCPSYQSTVAFPSVAGNLYTIQLGAYPGAAVGTGTFSFSINPAPTNDACAAPTVITGAGPFAYDTTFASTSAQGQSNTRCFIFNTSGIEFDVWYRWTAPSTGWFAVDSCVSGAHDMKIAVYAGAGCPVAEPLSCDDDACGTLGYTAKAAFLASAGAAYTIQLGSYPGSGGAPGGFSITPFTPGVGDDCAAPIDISGTGSFAWDTTSCTTGFAGQNEALCQNELLSYDQWFRWTSPCTTSVTFSMCAGAGADTKIAVYLASACPGSAALACNDDFCGLAGPSELSFSATAGATYMLQVGMWPGEIPSAGTFSLTTACPPSVGTVYCIGDGATPHTACPCGNNSAMLDEVGCLSSLGTGGKLRAIGTASLAADTVLLQGSQMPNSSCLYFQGTTQTNSGNGTLFGDGLRCAGGTVIRLKTIANSGGGSQYPGGGDPSVSVKGLVTLPGTRTYQAWYRNAAAFCTASTFNLTNGLEIAWGT